MNQILTGTKQICNFVGRSWRTVEYWIVYESFPARKINGVWESDIELITAWRRNRILQGQGQNGTAETDRKRAVNKVS